MCAALVQLFMVVKAVVADVEMILDAYVTTTIMVAVAVIFKAKCGFEQTAVIQHERGKESLTSHATLPFICTTWSELHTALIREQKQ